jgi:hypothetical protein
MATTYLIKKEINMQHFHIYLDLNILDKRLAKFRSKYS